MSTYTSKKPKNVITIYGRKPVLEVLQDNNIEIYKVHLADSNKPGGIINEITELCNTRNIEVCYHDKLALSRISKNKKQDQGVAADVVNRNLRTLEDFLKSSSKTSLSLLVLDKVTNPQNLGMIIRSACAGFIDGIVIPKNGCAKLDSLVIKASAGTVFKAPILECENTEDALMACREHGLICYGLSLENSRAIGDIAINDKHVYVLGNESEGISKNILALCDERIAIPMRNGVESLNVGATASILAYRALFIRN
ncbi:TrmH family RNA methyltransferase [Aurantivibrio infirmus]